MPADNKQDNEQSERPNPTCIKGLNYIRLSIFIQTLYQTSDNKLEPQKA